MKNKYIQILKINQQTVSWCFGLATFLMVLSPRLLDDTSGMDLRAKAKAEILAYQVMQLYMENAASHESAPARSMGAAYVRTPASIPAPAFSNQGLMGKDPWGQPYRYVVREISSIGADHGVGKVSVEMLSAGPDGVFDVPGDSPHQSDDIRFQFSF